jgi:thioredoxin reductase (NADPH)
MQTEHDLVIIGGGVAGLAAAQYGARAGLKVLVLEELAAGGQIVPVNDLENYPGFPEPIDGLELSQRFEEQALKFGARIETWSARSVRKEKNVFIVETDRDPQRAASVIVATGASHRKLGVPGEEKFTGRGVSYCATCDGPFFRGKPMLVVGGGDAACDEAMFLSKLTDRVLMIHRRDRFRAQKSLADRVLASEHIEVRFNTELKEIQGGDRVERVVLTDAGKEHETGEEVAAVFVFIGSVPQTQLLTDVALDEGGYILTDQRMETSVKGLFAAGDVRATPFRQLVVAAGEGAIAAHSAAQHIDDLKGEAYR